MLNLHRFRQVSTRSETSCIDQISQWQQKQFCGVSHIKSSNANEGGSETKLMQTVSLSESVQDLND